MICNTTSPSDLVHEREAGRRAGSGFRALATFDDGRYLWFWIETHDKYERLLRQL